VTDPAPLHNELETLADAARQEIEASRGSVADGFSVEARELCAAITARLVVAGVGVRLAELATTAWVLMAGRRSVLECVEIARAEEERGGSGKPS
jgi:hypothetical protein